MLRSPFLLVLALAVPLFAIPDDDKADALHAHPGVTLLTVLLGNLNLPVTWEHELSGPSLSLVVQPSLAIFTHDPPERRKPSDLAWGESRTQKLLVSAGPRWYFNGAQHRGLYMAGMLRTGIVRIDEESTADVAGTEGSLYIFGAMGHLGYRWATENLSIFTDIGFGYQKVREDRTGRPFRVSPVMVGAAGDFNLGLGYRL